MHLVGSPDWGHVNRAPASLPDELRAACRRFPDLVALDGEREQLTFAEFDRAVNRVAWGLVDRNVMGRPIGVIGPHEPKTFVTMFAVLAAGAVCVPLDAREPPDRLQSMIEQVGIELVVAPSTEIAGLRAGVELVTPTDLESRRDDDPGVSISPDAPALVYVTSGSTGRPKAIAHTHASLVW